MRKIGIRRKCGCFFYDVKVRLHRMRCVASRCVASCRAIATYLGLGNVVDLCAQVLRLRLHLVFLLLNPSHTTSSAGHPLVKVPHYKDCPPSKIEVRVTQVTLTHDLDFQSMARYRHDPHTHPKVQVQRSVGSKDRVETNGQTDRRTLPIGLYSRLTRSVTTTPFHNSIC